MPEAIVGWLTRPAHRPKLVGFGFRPLSRKIRPRRAENRKTRPPVEIASKVLRFRAIFPLTRNSRRSIQINVHVRFSL